MNKPKRIGVDGAKHKKAKSWRGRMKLGNSGKISVSVEAARK